jgi:DNA-binding NarL/FixJ family response regulator
VRCANLNSPSRVDLLLCRAIGPLGVPSRATPKWKSRDKGKKYVSSRVTNNIETFLLEPRVSQMGQEKLTNRQREVLQLLAEGTSMKEAAYMVKLIPRTIPFRKYKMEALRLRTNDESVQYAIREHVISPRS